MADLDQFDLQPVPETSFSVSADEPVSRQGFDLQEDKETIKAGPVLSPTENDFDLKDIDNQGFDIQTPGYLKIPEPDIITSSLTPSPIGQTPEAQSDINIGLYALFNLHLKLYAYHIHL